MQLWILFRGLSFPSRAGPSAARAGVRSYGENGTASKTGSTSASLPPEKLRLSKQFRFYVHPQRTACHRSTLDYAYRL